MLNRFCQWRPNRIPYFLPPFPSVLFSKRSSSVTLISEDSPPAVDQFYLSETICSLRDYGPHQFLRSNFDSALDVRTVEKIIDKLKDHSPELGYEFFHVLKNEYGFRHSRTSVFVVAHILAEKRRIKQLQEELMSAIQAEGGDIVSSLCVLLENDFKDWDSRVLVWDMLAFCYSRCEMLNEALFVLEKMKDLNLQPSIYTYNSMLHNLKHTTFVWDVYDEIKLRGIPPNEYTNSIVIDGLCKHSMVQEAIQFWRETDMKENGASVVSFNSLMSSICRVGLIVVAKSFLCSMLKHGLLPDAYSYNILIHGLCMTGYVEEALEFTVDMENNGIEPDIVTYNTLIKGLHLVGFAGGAEQVIQKMMLKSVNPSIVTYKVLLCRYYQTENVEAMLRLLHEMNSEIPMSMVSYSVLLSCLCKMGQLEKALSLLDEMKAMGVKPDFIAYSMIIQGMCKVGEMKKAIQLCDEIYSRRMFPSSLSHQGILSGLYNKQMMAEARMYYDALEKVNLSLDIVLYNIIMNGYVKIGRCEDAVQLYKQIIIEKGIRPSIVTFNSLIYGFCRSGKLGIARRWLATIKMHGLSPNVVTYTTLMDGYRKDGNTRGMLELLREMRMENVNPTHVTYTVLIKGLCKERRWQEAFQLLANMYVKGLNPDQITYNTIIQCLCEVRNVKRAFQLHDEMLLQNLQPSHVTYNLLLDGLCRYGELRDADKLLRFLLDQHIALTKVAYTTLIKAHCVKGDVSTAVLTFHWMMQKGFEISIKDFNAAISRLCKRGFLTEAKLFLSVMLSLGISPDIKLYELLNWAFFKHGS